MTKILRFLDAKAKSAEYRERPNAYATLSEISDSLGIRYDVADDSIGILLRNQSIQTYPIDARWRRLFGSLQLPHISKEDASRYWAEDQLQTPPQHRAKQKRCRRISELIKMRESHRCQACGFTFQKKNGNFYSEECHIQPVSRGGADHPKNILILCSNHHRMLDTGEALRKVNSDGSVVIVFNDINGQHEVPIWN